MKVLLTNDDGIEATGLRVMREALLEVPGMELAVIAPDSNRSATARSITTREPLWVDEVDFEDGGIGYATDGTPVDCVRFAALGLVEFEPELIVSGINHGANLGDDITYSGTVAAALEGVVLGIPAIAASQQAYRGKLDSWVSREWEPGGLRAGRRLRGPHGRGGGPRADARGHPPERELPGRRRARAPRRAGSASGSTSDRMKLTEEEGGRRRYWIYGEQPGYHEEDGTDFAALADDRIAVTPLHFDLTDQAGIESLTASTSTASCDRPPARFERRSG